MSGDRAWAHPQAIVETDAIGLDTRIWAFSHVMAGATVGGACNIGEHVFIEAGARVGDRVTIKNGVQIWEGVTLEDDVFVGPNAVFTNDRHPRSPRSEAAGSRYRDKGWLSPTIVREGASVGANATILCGAEIGRFAAVGAGAVVTRHVQPFVVVTGIPAAPAGYVCRCGQPMGDGWTDRICGSCGRMYRVIEALVQESGRCGVAWAVDDDPGPSRFFRAR